MAQWAKTTQSFEPLGDALFQPAVRCDLAGQLMVRGREAKLVKLAAASAPYAFLDLPWEEALQAFRERVPQRKNELERLLKAYAQRSDEARRLALEQIQKFVKGSLERHIAEGGTYGDFADDLEAGKESLGITTADPAYLKMVFRTNVQSAYGAGKFRAITDPDVIELRPFVEYLTVGDARVGDDHKPLHKTVYRVASARWRRIAPPNRPNCRCSINSCTADDVAGRDILGDVPKAYVAMPEFDSPPTPRIDVANDNAREMSVQRTPAKQLELAYNPSQARDGNGEWAAGGGAPSARKRKPGSRPALTSAERKQLVEPARSELKAAHEAHSELNSPESKKRLVRAAEELVAARRTAGSASGTEHKSRFRQADEAVKDFDSESSAESLRAVRATWADDPDVREELGDKAFAKHVERKVREHAQEQYDHLAHTIKTQPGHSSSERSAILRVAKARMSLNLEASKVSSTKPLSATAVGLAFNPGQQRAGDGKWTSTGGKVGSLRRRVHAAADRVKRAKALKSAKAKLAAAKSAHAAAPSAETEKKVQSARDSLASKRRDVFGAQAEREAFTPVHQQHDAPRARPTSTKAERAAALADAKTAHAANPTATSAAVLREARASAGKSPTTHAKATAAMAAYHATDKTKPGRVFPGEGGARQEAYHAAMAALGDAGDTMRARNFAVSHHAGGSLDDLKSELMSVGARGQQGERVPEHSRLLNKQALEREEARRKSGKV